MADFWLPSHFLTDDDILMDFGFSATKPDQVSGLVLYGFSSNSDLELTSRSTETESDEEDLLLSGLTRKMAASNLQDSSSCPVHVKGLVLSSSPQSTLCGCVCNQGSSRESMSGPVSPPQAPPTNNETLDLLNKAAGEVARLKMKTEKTATTGTGFFDCSQKGVLYPAPLRKPDHLPPLYFQPQFHHFSPMIWAPSNGLQYNPPKQQSQNRATKNGTTKSSVSHGRPLGLRPSAWPPLKQQSQAQAHPVPNGVPNGSMFEGPKRECAGTGVFLPRSVSAVDPRSKSEGNTTKTKNVKSSQTTHRRSFLTSSTTVNKHNDIQLPLEWTY